MGGGLGPALHAWEDGRVGPGGGGGGSAGRGNPQGLVGAISRGEGPR